MDDIDDFLNSIGLIPEVPEQETPSTDTQTSVNAEETPEQEPPSVAQPTEDIDETPENDGSEEVIQVLSDLERDFSDTLVVEEGEISTTPRETLSPEEEREAENLFGELFSEDTVDDEGNTDEEEEEDDEEDDGENWETTPDETIAFLDSLEENNPSPEEEQLPMDTAEETINAIIGQEETVEEETVVQEEETQEATLDEGKFPQNSPTLLVDESTSRFSAAMW